MERSYVLLFFVLVSSTIVCADESQLVGGQDSSPVETFNCYFCSTSHGQGGVDGACGNGFDPTDLFNYLNCGGACTKNVIYDTETDEIVAMNRLCEATCPGDRHCTQESNGRKTCSYCCTSDLCNSTTKIGINHTMVALFVLAALLLRANFQNYI